MYVMYVCVCVCIHTHAHMTFCPCVCVFACFVCVCKSIIAFSYLVLVQMFTLLSTSNAFQAPQPHFCHCLFSSHIWLHVYVALALIQALPTMPYIHLVSQGQTLFRSCVTRPPEDHPFLGRLHNTRKGLAPRDIHLV